MELVFKVEKKLNRTGKRPVYFGTINGFRVSRINHIRKWEAERFLENIKAHYSHTEIAAFIGRKQKAAEAAKVEG